MVLFSEPMPRWDLKQTFYIAKKETKCEVIVCKKCSHGLSKLTNNTHCNIMSTQVLSPNKQTGLIAYNVRCYVIPEFVRSI